MSIQSFFGSFIDCFTKDRIDQIYDWKFREYYYGFFGYLIRKILVVIGIFYFLALVFNSFFFSTLYLILFGIVFYLRGGIKNFKTDWAINYKLTYVIGTNKLYDTHVVDGKVKPLTIPRVNYSYDDNSIIIRFRLDGSRHSLKFTELEEQLSSAFILNCVSVNKIDGYVVYEFERNKAQKIVVDDRAIGARPNSENVSDEIVINSNLAWNYRKQPHALVTGITGGGKTYLLAYFIRMFLSYDADIKILDPKRSDLSFLEKYFGKDVVYEPNHIARVLRESVETMNKRYDEFRNLENYAFGKDFKDYGYKPLFIIFDEVTAFMASADSKVVKEVNSFLTEIILKGRQAGIFMILTTQRADADYIKANIRDQLGLRIGLGRMSSSGYTMTFGSEYNDLCLNGSEKGIGFIFIDGVTDKPIQFESPYLTDKYDFIKDIEELMSNKL